MVIGLSATRLSSELLVLRFDQDMMNCSALQVLAVSWLLLMIHMKQKKNYTLDFIVPLCITDLHSLNFLLLIVVFYGALSHPYD